MEKEEVIDVLRDLARGLDPRDRTQLDPESPIVTDGRIVRTLFRAVEMLESSAASSGEMSAGSGGREREGPARRGARWTQDEEDEVIRDFLAEEDVPSLAERFERTEGAIRGRLWGHAPRDRRPQYPRASDDGELRDLLSGEREADVEPEPAEGPAGDAMLQGDYVEEKAMAPKYGDPNYNKELPKPHSDLGERIAAEQQSPTHTPHKDVTDPWGDRDDFKKMRSRQFGDMMKRGREG